MEEQFIKGGLKVDIGQDLKQRVVNHRETFRRIFSLRYLEMLPTLFTYTNTENLSINFLKMETALNQGVDIVIGEANGNLQILGYVTNRDSLENPSTLFSDNRLTKDDINFIIPKKDIPKYLEEITYLDNCQSGNFVVVRNKTLNYVSDREIINHYTNELAEIVLSRFSLTMQTKIQTFFKGDEGDEDINQLVSDLYNGAPFVKIGKFFDIKDNMIRVENDNIALQFAELKREYQNKVSELNNMLGINSLAVEKSSGVSDTEAKSNRAFTTSMANIKIESRNDAFKKLNKRYNTKVEVIYNDEVASELMEIAKLEGDGDNNTI